MREAERKSGRVNRSRRAYRLMLGAAAAGLGSIAASAWGADKTWSGAVDGSWDVTTQNWLDGAPPTATTPTTYNVGDGVFFTDNFSGTNTTIFPTSSSTNALSLSFVHTTGSVPTNYIFNRSGDSPASGVTPFGSNTAGVQQLLLLDTGFLGQVNLRARANAASNGKTIIRSGVLELNDAGALPAIGGNSANNSGPVELAGGTLAINVNTAGNTQASSGQFAGTITVTANSTLANTSTLDTGGPLRIWGSASASAINVNDGATLTIVPGLAGARLDSKLSGAFTLGTNAGVLRMGTPGAGGANASFDTGSGGGIIRAGGSTLNLGALSGSAGTQVQPQDSAGPGTDTISIGGKNIDAAFNGTIVDGINATPRTAAVTKIGTGTQTLAGANTYTGATTVTAGTLRVTGSIATSSGVTVNGGTFEAGATQTVQSLVVNDGGTAVVSSPSPGSTTVLKTPSLALVGTGTVDLKNGAMVVDYAAGNSPLATLKPSIVSGYASGAGNGPGIRTSASGRAVGYGEASDLLGASGGTFLGQQVDGDALLFRSTLRGDANLDGSVDFNDLVRLAQNYNAPATLWTQGDFTYDDKVDFADLVALAQNYNATLPSAAALAGTSAQFQADVAKAFAQVPEPGVLSLTLVGGIGLLARRRQRRR